ncbi:MAG: response regulator [Panacagrimonas sp.]
MFTQALIVEDHADARNWLVACLHTAFPGIVIATAATCAEGEAMLDRRPQIALIDLNLPDGFGIDLVAKASRMRPPVRSIVTTIYDDDAHIFPALRAGASGYLLKDEPREELVRQLLQLARDEPPLSPTIMRSVLKYFADQNPMATEPEERLTAKERDVLVSIANGYTLEEIAKSHGVTRNTVATHVKRIYAKLKITNRAEAVQAAQRIGLLARS